MDYDHPTGHDAGLGFRLQDIGRGGFVMDQVGTWRQNETRRDVHQEK
jgi:hypothetical protein